MIHSEDETAQLVSEIKEKRLIAKELRRIEEHKKVIAQYEEAVKQSAQAGAQYHHILSQILNAWTPK